MTAKNDALTLVRGDAVRLLGISAATFSRLEAEGVFKAVRKGSGQRASVYAAPALVAAYIAHRDRMSNRLDLQSERAALARSQRKKVDMDIAEREGKLVSAEEVRDVWTQRQVEIRESMLNVAGVAVQAGVIPVERERDLDDMIRAALTALGRRTNED